MIKRSEFKTEYGFKVGFVPDEDGSARLAYIRLEDSEGRYLGSIDDLKHVRILHRWAERMLKARQRKKR